MGGPAVRDRLFFFFNYEGRRDRSEAENLRNAVPLAPIFNCQIPYRNTSGGISIADASTVAALDPQGIGCNQAILDLMNTRYPVGDPAVGGNGVTTGGFRFNSPDFLDNDVFISRVDYEHNENHTFFARWTIRDFEESRRDGPIQQWPGDPPTTFGRNKPYSYVIGHTYRPTATIVNDARVGVSRQNFQFTRIDNPGFPNEFDFAGTAVDDPFVELDEQGRVVPVPTIKDDFTLIAGAHTFQAGANIRPIRQKSNLTNDFNFVDVGLGGLIDELGPSLRPADLENSVTAREQWDEMFTLLLGRFSSISTNFNYDVDGNAFAPGTGKSRNFAYNEFEFYVQDTWRLHPTLTMNLGVRWSYYEPPYEVDGFQACNDTDFQNFFDARLTNAAAGVGGTGSVPLLRYDLCGKGNARRSIYEPDLDNWGPRAALAWNPSFRGGALGALFGDRKTVIRAGGSILYDRVAGALTFIQDQVSYLFDNNDLFLFGAADPVTALANDPRFTSVGTVPNVTSAPTISRPFTPFGGLGLGQFNYAMVQNFETPFSYTFDLSLQREIPGGMLAEVAYAGRLGRDLFGQADAAQIVNFVDPTSGQGLFEAFQAVQLQVAAGQPVSPQPWFENLCFPGCTGVMSFFFPTLFETGDMADTIFFMQALGFLQPEVGLGSQFSSNNYIGNFHSSNYHGMLFSLRKSYAQGLDFDFNYTWAHAIDTNSNVTNTIVGGTVCNLLDRGACRANADFDVRHFINVNWFYDLPWGRGRAIGSGMPGWLDQIIGGWTVSGIVTWRTGFPVQTRTGSFPFAFFFGAFDGGYPAVFTGDASGFNRDIHTDADDEIQYFADPDAALNGFRFPLPGEVGSRNAIRGPRFFNLDLGILKSFRMPYAEGHRLQFRWEMFNAFNNVNFADPALDISDVDTFGRITETAGSARVMQFALRYEF